MSDWKNIVVENAAGGIGQNVDKSAGFSDVLPLDQGGFDNNGTGAFNNSYGIWDQGSDSANLTPILLNRGGIFASTPTYQDTLTWDGTQIGDFAFGRNQVYMLAPVPQDADGTNAWPNLEGAIDANSKPYYWYEYANSSGPLSVSELTANTIPILGSTEGAVTTDVTVPDAVTFTALANDGATWTVNGTLDLTDSTIGDVDTLASLAAWTDSGSNTVTDEDTITFNPGGTIAELEANSDAHFSSGFRIYNVDTKSIVQDLNMSSFYYGGSDTVTILQSGTFLVVDDLTEGGWTLTWSKGFNDYELSADDITISQANSGTITLTKNTNTPTEHWEHITSFYQWSQPGAEQSAEDIKFTAVNKKSVQFGITCESSLTNFEFNRGAIYPSFHSMCGQVNMDASNDTQSATSYGVTESIMLTNSGSETDAVKTFTGAIAVVSEKPQIRIDVSL
jgi:hypothetical protein